MCTSKKPPKGADLIQKLRYFVHVFNATFEVYETPSLLVIRDFIKADSGPEDANLFTTIMWSVFADLEFRRVIGLAPDGRDRELLADFSKSASHTQLMEIGYAIHSMAEFETAKLEDWSYVPTHPGLPSRGVPIIYLRSWCDQLRRLNKGGAIPEVEAIASQIEAHTR